MGNLGEHLDGGTVEEGLYLLTLSDNRIKSLTLFCVLFCVLVPIFRAEDIEMDLAPSSP